MNPEQDLIRRAQEGDAEAFRGLVLRHQARLFSFVGNLLPRRHDREDVVQDVFLRAWTRLSSYRPERARFSTWLFAIARHRCLDLLAAAARNPRLPLPAVLDTRAPPYHAERSELLAQLDDALERLPTHQRTALVLADLVGLPYAEIATIEGVRPGTVKSRVSRARRALAAIIPCPTEIPP